MKKVTCGVAIVHVESGQILMGHSTGNIHWDILKGCQDPGESPLETALREAQEESGLCLAAEALIDLGELAYNSEKNLHLFLHLTTEPIEVSKLECTSMFISDKGIELPEMDKFSWFVLSEENLNRVCAKNMKRVLIEQLLPLSKFKGERT